MKTKKENILVLVTAGKESKRFMELAKDAAEAGNGDLYILHVAQGENILESGEMYEMQRLADYGCRLGGQVCLCCEQDVAAYISRFAREKDITGVLLEPPVKKEKKSIWKELNCTPFVRQYDILKTSGVIFYAKRSSKQTIYIGIQATGSRNDAGRRSKSQ